jgi:pilus assembly protein FimV
MLTLTRGLAFALLLGASAAHAAGLGKLTVNSALGQPLNAEIDLVSLQPGESDAVVARVASPEQFREANIEYTSSLRLLRFAVDKRANGQPFLKVTSIAPINEPFVDVLVEMSWPAGRIQREYPILLDPPGYAQGKVAAPTVAATPRTETPPAPAPAVSSSTTPAPAQEAAAAPTPPTAPSVASGSPSAQAEMAASGNATATDTYGPVQKGDTLRKIAESTKPSSVSLEQMLVALYRENKSAFSGNNMNRLKTGQILKVPSAEEVEKIQPKEANREYRTQVADWKSYREQLASGVAAIPAKPESTASTSGRISSAAVTPPPAPAPTSSDVLKLSKSPSGKGSATAGAASAAAAQERINAMQEELTAKDKALREAQSRVSDLEKQIRDMQRLAELKATVPGKDSSKVAIATPPAASKPAEAPKPAEPVKPAEAPKAAEPPKAAETKPTPTSTSPAPAVVADASKAGEAKKPGESTTTSTTTTTTPATTPAQPPKAADASKPAPKKVVAPPPPPPGMMDEILDNPLLLAGGIGVIALGIGAFLFMRRRRQRADDYGTTSEMASSFPSDLKPTTGTGKPAAGLVDTGNSSFLTDFDKTGPGTIDTDEVDPVAEAEVYIAYGRDAQAEEILKEAMARDRNRHEIALKLLEIYHARKSATAFETVAKELKGSVGEDSPLWHKAAAMGAQIDPNNPLYGGAASSGATYTAMAPAAPAPKPDLDFDIEAQSQGGAASTSSSFDLNLDSDKSASHTPAAEASHGLDFDLESSSSKPAIDVPAEHKEEKPAFDFDLSGLEMPGSKKSEPASESKGGAMDLADLNLDSAPADGGGGEGVGTKLELAKAYLEIGDKDGAREILQEVAKEGSSAQRAEAQKLIATL